MRLPEKFCIVIEYGSSYSDDAWEPVAVCTNETVADKWIEIAANKRGVNKSMYHKTKVPYIFNAEASMTKTLFPDDEIDDDPYDGYFSKE